MELIKSYREWHTAQPQKVSYTQAVNFISSLTGRTKGEAELELAQLHHSNEIKIISRKNGNGRRIFLKPLTPLSEEVVRESWNAKILSSTSLNKIVSNIHDNTGHEPSEIMSFLKQLDSCEIQGERFKWKDNDLPDDY